METLSFEESEVQEAFFDRGWTDGLPIVPPTPERVAAALRTVGLEPDELVGNVPQRRVSVSAEKVAVNAVMAGCKPDYFPVVVTAVSAMLDPQFNAHTVTTSTGGAAICVIVSGPMVREIGLNTRHNALGSGFRANATIGRAVRLVAMNVLGARPGGMDGSSIGHPGKYTLCIAEDTPPEPWEPLRVELGYRLSDTTVTVVPTEGPRQIANHLNPSGRGVLQTFAAAMKNPSTYCVGKGGQVVVVLGPEHTQAMIEEGWSRQAVREFLVEQTRVSPEELNLAGVLLERDSQHTIPTGKDGKLPTVPSTEDVFLVTAGGAGAGWSAYLPTWAPKIHSRASTRRVRRAGEGLPDCGPDSCEIRI